jgi:signal transduction histidine kinase
VEGFEAPLWRALAVFRITALVYPVALVVRNGPHYAHPVAGYLVLAFMVGWTAFVTVAYRLPRWRGWPLLAADLAVAAGCLLASPWVEGPRVRHGLQTLTVAWMAAPVMAWAIARGRRRGAVAAVLMGVTDLWVRGHVAQDTLTASVLMLLAAIAVGDIARLGLVAERRLQRAVELEAANRERERLGRGIHDSVLQVLALVARRGAELGGEAAELGRLAGAQEGALRSLVSGPDPAPGPGSPADLAASLRRFAGARVTVAGPATPVRLPAAVLDEVVAAVGSALDNVSRHCGPDGRAWVLVEEEPDVVTVTVRDDGPGIAPGRLVEAAAAGRLGVVQSIQGRVRDLGGTVAISSRPGEGTEVQLRVPRVVVG